ncbi:hypothetical protein DAI22_03g241287 [Oryza sativa Japonica Group]|nr:hypothetical protein DAI22_03g241287 [Oryza sativa Japonica Group]
MGNGVFKKTEVLAAVKHKKSGISGSTNSYNAVVRENAQLRHEVTEQRGMIREQRGMIQEHRGMLKAVYEKLGMDIPEEVLSRWESQREDSELDVDCSEGSEEYEIEEEECETEDEEYRT